MAEENDVPTPAPTPDPPAPTPAPEPVSTPAHDSGDRLDRLEGIVNGLVEAVNKLIPNDEKPTRKPWTHFGSRDRD